MELLGEIHILSAQVRKHITKSGYVAFGVRKAFNQPDADRVATLMNNIGILSVFRRAAIEAVLPQGTRAAPPAYKFLDRRLGSAAGQRTSRVKSRFSARPASDQSLPERLHERQVVSIGR